jgi:ABC-2 type transport system permease protein
VSAIPKASVVAAELLKVGKRWLPYVLLAIVVAFLALQVFGTYAGSRGEAISGGQSSALWRFALPWSLPMLLDSIQFIGAILLGVLAASVVGTEYGWGTVRQALARGQTRTQYLTTKLLGIAVLSVVGLLLAFALGIIFAAIVNSLADRPITLNLPGEDGLSLADVALMALRTAHGILPYVLLAFCLAVVGRSTTLGVAGVLAYMMVEAMALGILGGIGGVAAEARAYSIGHNVSALLAANRIGPYYFSWTGRTTSVAAELPDVGVAVLVLTLYCVVFLGIAYWVFQRRDLGSDSGAG